MDIHRCRFIDYKPSAIHQISSIVAEGAPLVAVARADGDIELWRTNDAKSGRRTNWICQHVLHHDHPIESLALSLSPEDFDDDDEMELDVPAHRSSPRLFVATVHGSITEYSLETLKSLIEVDSYGGGAIWCISISPCQKYLAAGCEDGCIRLYDIDGPPGSLQYIRCFEKQKGRIVCITWEKNYQSASCDFSSYVLFTGGSDGIIRKWNVSTGRSIQRMAVGAPQSGEELLVWNIECLSNGEIASSDSLGSIKFWDSRTCTLRQTFRAHSADALALAANSKGNIVFSAGIDNKIFMFCRTEETVGSPSRWILTQYRKFHTHDIRVLHWSKGSSLPLNFSKKMKRGRDDRIQDQDNPQDFDYLFSGGVDTYLNVLPRPADLFTVKNYQPTRLPPFRRESIAKVNAQHRLVIGNHQNEITLYRVGTILQGMEHVQNLLNTDGAKFLATIRLKSNLSIDSLEISPDGNWISVVDSKRQVHVYHIKETGRSDTPVAVVNMSAFLGDIKSDIFSTVFLGDRSLALAAATSIMIFDLELDTGSFSLRKTIKISYTTSHTYLSFPVSIKASKCGRFLAVSNSWNELIVIDAKKKKQYAVPTEKHVNVGFMCIGTLYNEQGEKNHLLFYTVYGKGSSQTRIRAYDFLKNKFSALDDHLQKMEWLAQRKEKISGMMITGKDEPVLFVWSHRWLARAVLPTSCTKVSEKHTWSSTTHFENILGFGFLKEDEAVVIEKPWVDILERMTPPLVQKKYGI